MHFHAYTLLIWLMWENYTANYSDTWPDNVWLVNKRYVSMMSLGIQVLGNVQQLYQWWVLYDAVQNGDDKVKYWNDSLWLFREKN